MKKTQSPPEKRGNAPLPGDLGRIAEIAGLQAALSIAREFRGTTIYVPDILRRPRDDSIRQEYDKGAPVRRIALKYGLTERCVRKILKRA